MCLEFGLGLLPQPLLKSMAPRNQDTIPPKQKLKCVVSKQSRSFYVFLVLFLSRLYAMLTCATTRESLQQTGRLAGSPVTREASWDVLGSSGVSDPALGSTAYGMC